MTIKTSGSLSMAEINAEFGLGTDLYAYRGVRWYRDDNSRGYFDQAMGNNPPVDMLEFYGKRKTIPVTPMAATTQANGTYFTIPFYNKITVVIQGGNGGQSGAWGGYYKNNVLISSTASSPGSNGSGSSFGSYGSAAGGAGGNGNSVGGSSGDNVTIIFDAETDINAPLKGITILSTIGTGGGGGAGGAVFVFNNTTNQYQFAYYAPSGANGAGGYITVKVE